MTSISAEALVASCGEIGTILHLSDDKSMLEPLNGPPIGLIDSNSEGVIVTDSQARYLSRSKFRRKETKMNRFIDAMPIGDTFMQATSSEKHVSDSSIIQVNFLNDNVLYLFSAMFTTTKCLMLYIIKNLFHFFFPFLKVFIENLTL